MSVKNEILSIYEKKKISPFCISLSQLFVKIIYSDNAQVIHDQTNINCCVKQEMIWFQRMVDEDYLGINIFFPDLTWLSLFFYVFSWSIIWFTNHNPIITHS